MKKITAFLTSFLITLTAVSCGQKPVSEPPQETAEQAAYSLKTADISMSDEFSEIMCLDIIGDTSFVFGQLTDDSFGGFLGDVKFEGLKGFSFEPSEGEAIISAALISSESFAVLTCSDGMTYIRIFDASGIETDTMECGELISDEVGYIRLYRAENGFYINESNDTVTYIDESGKVQGSVRLNGRDIAGMVKNGDKQPIILLTDMEGKCTAAELDGTGLSNERRCGEMPDSLLAACAGVGEYTLVGIFYDAMYGLKDDEWVRLTNFIDNSFETYNVHELLMDSADSFIFSVKNGEKAVLSRVTKRSQSENVERQVIKIAALYDDPNTNYIMKNYNSQSEKYKIEPVYYTQSSDPEENLRALKMDMISGKAPDIIPFSTAMPVDSFGSSEGIFADIYELIDADTELDRSDFIEEYLEGLSSKGKLYLINPSFTIKTVMCKEKYLGGITDWTYSDMMRIYKDKPDSIAFSACSAYMPPRDVFLDIIQYSEFVDYDSASCNFDSDTFIELLKFFKENSIGTTGNADGFTSDELSSRFRNDRIMLDVDTIPCFLYMPTIRREMFGDDPAVFLGYPTAEGSRSYVEVQEGFSILGSSENKEGAWDFLKFAITGVDMSKVNLAFPILKKLMDRDMEYTMKRIEEWRKDDDSVVLPTAEEMEEYRKWVTGSARNVIKFDSSINAIIYDELNGYFYDGNSAENTAKMIQDRVSLYLSEQYQ